MHARMHARTPGRALDIGRTWSRWPGEPNFENGKLVCPVSTFIRSFGLPSFLPCARPLARSWGRTHTYVRTRAVGLDPKRRERAGGQGDYAAVTFSDRGPVGQFSLDTRHWSQLFAIFRDGRSVLANARTFGFFADPGLSRHARR